MAWKTYSTTQITEVRPYIPGEDMTNIEVSQADMDNGSPLQGDMIGRDPNKPGREWVIGGAFFREYMKEVRKGKFHGMTFYR